MSILKLIGGVVSNVAIFGGLLFLPVGTLNWWRAWVFLGVVFVGAVVSTVSLYRTSKELLEETFKPPVQKDSRWQPRSLFCCCSPGSSV